MSGWYNRAKAGGLDAAIASTMKVMLVDSSYTFNPDHDVVGSGAGTPGGAEVSGSGYIGGYNGTGRKILTGVSVTRDDVNNRSYLSAAQLTWLSLSVGSIAAAILFVQGTDDSDSLLVAYVNDGLPATPASQHFRITWNAAGLLQVT